MATLTLRREDGRVVCERVFVADRAHHRIRGLLGRRRLEPGEGMVLRPAWNVHTAFMRFPIDVVFLDADQVVIRIAPSLPSWRTVSCRGAREVVELAAGECARRGLEAGDRVTWAARPLNGDAPGAGALTADRHEVRADGDGAAPARPIRVLLGTRDDRFLRLPPLPP